MNNLFIQKEKTLGLIIPLLTFNFE
jgi:hypothetical protein